MPFAIPEKWKWCNFGNVVAYGKCEQVLSQNIEKSAWILDLEDIESGTGNLLQKKKGASVQSNKNRFKKGDVLYSKLRPYLNKVIVADEDGYCTTEIVPITPSVAQAPLDALYLKIYLMSPYFVGYANRCSYGVKMPRLGTKDAKKALFPVPPIKEQYRIVQRLNELILEIDKAESAYNELAGPLSDRLRQLLLERAIQGKLVPQLESEPAVEQIGKLIDTKPFSIPSKWKWAQLKNVTTKITDGTHHSPPSANKGDFLYITAKNIKSTGVDLTNVTYVSKEIHEEIFKRCNPEYGDVLFIKDGATTGVVTINYLENPFSLLSSVALLKVKRELLLPEFLVYVLRSQYARDIVAKQMQGTGIPRVTLKKLKDLWIPIPPLNEQHRISQKLQDLITAMPLF